MYLQSTMAEDCLNSLAILSIERDYALDMDFELVIDNFSEISSHDHRLLTQVADR